MTYLRKNLKDTGIPELIICRKGMYFLDVGKTESDYSSIMAIKGHWRMKTGRSSGKCRISESFMGVLIWNFVQKSGLMGSGLIWDALYSSV